MQPTVAVTGRAEQRIQAGHLWIYKSDVLEVQAGARGHRRRARRPRPADRPGALQRPVADHAAPAVARRRAGGRGVLAPAARAARSPSAPALAIDATAYRLVHAEGDLLPSLIVDRYGDYLVLQSLSQGVERLLPTITGLLVDLLAPRGILARNDVKVRALEGLEPRVEVLHGEVPRVDPGARGADRVRRRSRGRARRPGCSSTSARTAWRRRATRAGRLLDCFSYNGGFAMRLAPRCDEVTAVDISADAVARIAANAARNGLPQDRGARGERVRRTAPARAGGRALRHDRARPAGVRQEQGVGAERRSPATATSTSARSAC